MKLKEEGTENWGKLKIEKVYSERRCHSYDFQALISNETFFQQLKSESLTNYSKLIKEKDLFGKTHVPEEDDCVSEIASDLDLGSDLDSDFEFAEIEREVPLFYWEMVEEERRKYKVSGSNKIKKEDSISNASTFEDSKTVECSDSDDSTASCSLTPKINKPKSFQKCNVTTTKPNRQIIKKAVCYFIFILFSLFILYILRLIIFPQTKEKIVIVNYHYGSCY